LENKKDVEAEALLNEFLLDESLSPAVRRKTLVTLSGLIKWKRPDEANQYLDQAEGIPAADSSDLAQTGWTRGWIYKIKGQPDNAMEVWLPLLELRGAHPAHLSSISSDIAGIYRQNNDDENARKYFQLAVDYGKKVQYKFDYSAAEKALEKMK
jgi:tetratricopeptide (TPR) repeat protein